MKRCTKCGETKQGDAFPYSSRNKLRLDSWCRSCRNAASKHRRLADPEREREQQAKWRAKNGQAWRDANKERVRALQAKYRASNKEKCNAANRRYRAENAERVREAEAAKRATEKWKSYVASKCREYQAKKLQAVPSWANSEFEQLVLREAYSLARSRSLVTGRKWHVDHVVPLQSDIVCGFHCAANLEVITAKANLAKRNWRWPDMP